MMRTITRNFLLLLIVWLSGVCFYTPQVSAEQLRVNMFAGIKRGGFGDVAANLVMARLLKRAHPEWKIQFWIAADETSAMKTLLPELNPALGKQNLEDIQFYFGKDHPLPPGDYFLAFAVKDSVNSATSNYAKDFYVPAHEDPVNVYERIYEVANAPLIFHFKEFGGESFQMGHIWNGGTNRLFHFETGPVSAGLYVSETRPKTKPTFNGLLSHLLKSGYSISPNALENAHIGFGYSAFESATFIYVQAAARLAQKNTNQRYLVFVKKFEKLKFGKLPNNLLVVESSQMPFSLTEQLIQLSTLPVLVTGDVSESLAIEHEKPFLYELNAWKLSSTAKLAEALTRDSEYFTNPENQATLKTALRVNKMYLTENPEHHNREIDRLFQDETFSKEFRSQLKRTRAALSLPKFVDNTIQTLEKVRAKGVDPATGKKSVALQALKQDGMVTKETLRESFTKFCSGLLTKLKATF